MSEHQSKPDDKSRSPEKGEFSLDTTVPENPGNGGETIHHKVQYEELPATGMSVETGVSPPHFLTIDPGSQESPNEIGTIRIGDNRLPVVGRITTENSAGFTRGKNSEFLIVDMRKHSEWLAKNNIRKARVRPYIYQTTQRVDRLGKDIINPFVLVDTGAIAKNREWYGDRKSQLHAISRDPDEPTFINTGLQEGSNRMSDGLPMYGDGVTLTLDDRGRIIVSGRNLDPDTISVRSKETSATQYEPLYRNVNPQPSRNETREWSDLVNELLGIIGQQAYRSASIGQTAESSPKPPNDPNKKFADLLIKDEMKKSGMDPKNAYRRAVKRVMSHGADLPDGVDANATAAYLNDNYGDKPRSTGEEIHVNF